jgi:glycosyltransferase involved in cell wall biosynthesis
VENRGKGFTLREGVANTRSEKVVYTDIDFPYQRENLLAIIKALDSADVAIGVRAEDYYHNMPAIRIWVSKTLRICIRLLLRIPTDDTQCGLKGFNNKGKQVFLTTTIDRYLFDLEFVFLAARKKLNVQKVPVQLKEGIVLSKLNMRILWRESVNFVNVFLRSIIY